MQEDKGQKLKDGDHILKVFTQLQLEVINIFKENIILVTQYLHILLEMAKILNVPTPILSTGTEMLGMQEMFM